MRSTRTFARAAAATAAAVAVMASLSPPAVGDPAEAQPAQSHDLNLCPWMDTILTPEERAHRLLDASSLEQKMRWLVEHPATQPENNEFRGVTYPDALPCLPDIQFSDGPYGVQGASPATAFPAPIAEASIWDPEVTFDKYATISREAWGHRRTVHLGPGLSGGRNPLAPRTSEYLGEDPVLAGVLAGAGVRGLQEGNPGRPTMANLKHYVANEQRGPLERMSSSNMDERTLREHYNLSFEIASREGNPRSVMCSYNAVNGISACENRELTDLLRDSGFEGFIMSDFNGVYSTTPSLKGGMDMELNRPVYYTPELLHAALDAGEITESDIDRAAFNVIHALIAVGLFDVERPSEVADEIITPQSLELARTMAEKGSVLLKNDGALPLSDEAQTVAVIGRTASNDPTDGVSAITVCGAHQGRVDCSDNTAPLDSITERVEEAGGQVVFHNGLDIAEAATVAAEADVAIVFGYSFTDYREDYPNLNLLHDGDALVEAVAAANDRTIVTLTSGTAVVMPWLDDVEAVLHMWYPGQQMGPALANLLWGDANPSGKLPMTFPRSVEDTPFTDEARYPGIVDEDGWLQVDYTEGLEVGYRWYEAQGIDPLFAFGHGLSYTAFEYSDLSVTPESADGTGSVTATFTLTNTGDVTGTEVAQLYADLPEAADVPAHRLVGFDRVTLEAGESRTVTIELTAQQQSDRHLFQVWDADADSWVTHGGTVGLKVGGASDDLTAPATFTIGEDVDPGPTPGPTEPTPDPTTPTPDPAPTTPPATTGDLYTTPGFHHVNDRRWMTVCEPYSQTNRCHTYIWATQVHRVGDAYFQTNGWAFNTLTYAPSPRSLWASNPLGNTGSWTASDGRQWRTECDTPATGRNGCRSYAMAKVIERTDAGFRTVEKWVVNNIVRFS